MKNDNYCLSRQIISWLAWLHKKIYRQTLIPTTQRESWIFSMLSQNLIIMWSKMLWCPKKCIKADAVLLTSALHFFIEIPPNNHTRLSWDISRSEKSKCRKFKNHFKSLARFPDHIQFVKTKPFFDFRMFMFIRIGLFWLGFIIKGKVDFNGLATETKTVMNFK